MLSLLAGLSIPLTLFSTPGEKPKPNQDAAAGQTKPTAAQLEILDQATTLIVQMANTPNVSGIATVYLRNDGDDKINKVAFSATLQDENGKSCSLSSPAMPGEGVTGIGTIASQDELQNKTNDLVGHSIKPFELQIKLDKGLPVFDSEDTFIPHTLTGYLVVKGDVSLIKSRPLKLIPAAPSKHSAYPLWFGLIAAIAAVVLSALLFRPKLNQRMGLPEWTASGSLATNLTALGTVLMTVLASTALPASTHILLKSEYATLGLLFGVLVLLAPIVYNSIRVQSKKDPTVYEGYVGMFLLASVVTLWGVFGQLTTLWYLVGELWEARYMPHDAVMAFRACIAAVTGLLFFYALVAIRVKVHKSKTAVPTHAPTTAAGKPAAATSALPKWRLL